MLPLQGSRAQSLVRELLVFEGLLQRLGRLCLTTGTRPLAAEVLVLGSTPLREPSESLPLAPPRSLPSGF